MSPVMGMEATVEVAMEEGVMVVEEEEVVVVADYLVVEEEEEEEADYLEEAYPEGLVYCIHT